MTLRVVEINPKYKPIIERKAMVNIGKVEAYL